VRETRQVVVARLGRLLPERVEVAVLALEVLVVEVERLAVLAGLVGAAMSVELLLAQCTDRHVARRTGQGYRIGRRPCCRGGRHRAALGCGCARAWRLISGLFMSHWEGVGAYLLRCSNLLKSRPQVGIGHEWDFCGYGPVSIMVALRARRYTLGAP
jgi:hypothetical protein